jgi:hypothetical protein
MATADFFRARLEMKVMLSSSCFALLMAISVLPRIADAQTAQACTVTRAVQLLSGNTKLVDVCVRSETLAAIYFRTTHCNSQGHRSSVGEEAKVVAACPDRPLASCLESYPNNRGRWEVLYYSPIDSEVYRKVGMDCRGTWKEFGSSVSGNAAATDTTASGASSLRMSSGAAVDPVLMPIVEFVLSFLSKLDQGDQKAAFALYGARPLLDANRLFPGGPSRADEVQRLEFWKRSMRGRLTDHRVQKVSVSRSAKVPGRESFTNYVVSIESNAEKQRAVQGDLRRTSISTVQVVEDNAGKLSIRGMTVEQ